MGIECRTNYEGEEGSMGASEELYLGPLERCHTREGDPKGPAPNKNF